MASDRHVKSMVIDLARNINWETAARTFGNSHNSLIGLVVDAWIGVAPKARYVLEAPPALKENKKRKENARRHSDVILVHGVLPVGIVEVEGLNPCKACEKMAHYLKIRKHRFSFGLCVFYACRPRGKGPKKELHWLKVKDAGDKDAGLRKIKKKAEGISCKTDKPLMLIFVDKEYESDPLDPKIHLRAEGAQYGRGKVNHVFGYMIVRGKSGPEINLWDGRNRA